MIKINFPRDDIDKDSEDFKDEHFQLFNNEINNLFKEFFYEINEFFIESQLIIENYEGDYNEIENDLEDFDESDLENLEEKDTPEVIYVNKKFLSHSINHQALGMYDPINHIIYLADNLPPKIEKFIYFHELAHSKGIMDESDADDFAASKVGYYIK